jgi:hypothetical protein
MYKIINYFIAFIWIANGLFCKVLNLVPRHQQIIGIILGNEHERLLSILIGCAEVGMAIWILSGLKSRLNAFVQIIVIGMMNILEFILVPEMLLWGKFNAVFALILILVIYFNEYFYSAKKTHYN